MINFFKKHKPILTVLSLVIVVLFVFSQIGKSLEGDKAFNEDEFVNEDEFEPSYKENVENNEELKNNILFDEDSKIYTNLLYNITIDFPNNWEVDMGTTKHSVVRGVEKDSGIVLSFIPIELKKGTRMYKLQDTLQILYDEDKSAFEKLQKENLVGLTGIEISNLKTSKSYLKNQPTIRSEFNHILKDLEFEYEITTILHQFWKAPYSITLGLNVPTEFYEENPGRYNNLFTNFNFAAPTLR